MHLTRNTCSWMQIQVRIPNTDPESQINADPWTPQQYRNKKNYIKYSHFQALQAVPKFWSNILDYLARCVWQRAGLSWVRLSRPSCITASQATTGPKVIHQSAWRNSHINLLQLCFLQLCLELPDYGIRIHKKLQDNHCCGSVSGIRRLFDPWIWDR